MKKHNALDIGRWKPLSDCGNKRAPVEHVILFKLLFQKQLIYWDFHAQPSLRFTENGPKKRKYQMSGSCVHENALLMSEVRGEWADWLEIIKRQQ